MRALETEDERRRRLAENERYNRRTRAIERHAAAQEAQADALDRIAKALEVSALSAAISARAETTEGGRVWMTEFASDQMSRLSGWVKALRS